MYNIISMNSGGNKGFTIVETLIVLAIASTIIVVVLLAVPGLQRSSRNTTARTAANNIVAGWNEQTADLNGAAPSAPSGGSAGTISINSVSYKLASGITPTVFTATSGNNYAMGFSASATTSTLGTTGNTLSPNNVVVISSATCSTGSVTFGTSTQIAVLYPIENGGTGTVGCIQG